MRISEKEKLRDKVNQLLDDIGDLIRNERTNKNIKMAQLSEMAGVSSSVISDLENHKGVMPNIFTLISIANALDLPNETFINMMWGNLDERNTLEDIGKQERLKAALSDYGLRANYIDRVINQVNYYISLENLEIGCKLINDLCERKLAKGAESVRIDAIMFTEIKKNVDRIAKAKADLNL